MARFIRTVVASAGLVLSMGCGQGESFVPLPSAAEGSAVFFGPTTSPGGAWRGPFGVDEDFDPLRAELREGAEPTAIVVDLEALRTRFITFDSARLTELQLVEAEETCRDGRQLEGEATQVPLSEGLATAQRYTEGQWRSNALGASPLALRFPVNEALCVNGPALELRPFGAEREWLPVGSLVGGRPLSEDGADHGGFSVARAIDADTLMVGSGLRLYVLRRGEVWRDSPADQFALDELPPLSIDGQWVLRALVVDTERSQPDRVIALAGLSWMERRLEFRQSIVIELPWTRAGFGPPTTLLTSDGEVRFIEQGNSGRIVVGGELGALYVRPSAGADFVAPQGLRLEGVSFLGWAPGLTTDRPDVLIDRAVTLLFGDLLAGAPLRAENGDPLATTPHGLITRLAPGGGLEVYYGFASPEIERRRPDGSRETVTGYMPPSLRACESEVLDCGARAFTGAAETHLEITPRETVLLASSSCTHLIEYNPEAGCARGFGEPGSTPRTKPGRFLLGTTGDPDRLLLVGANGLLLEARW